MKNFEYHQGKTALKIHFHKFKALKKSIIYLLTSNRRKSIGWKIPLLIFLLFSTHLGFAQEKFTFSGYIKNASNGEDLIGASIYLPAQGTGTTSNESGFFSITLPAGDYTFFASYMGYKSKSLSLKLNADLIENIDLEEEQFNMQEVVVTEKNEDNNITDIEMSSVRLDAKTLKSIPALLGEVDIVRSIQLLPGVSSVGEGATGFNVRGGGIDQNLILLDDAPIFNSSHLMGFFSVFNPDAVKDVKLLKGGIPAQYGGRLSSLLDVRMKEGNSQNMEVSGGIGTVASRIAIEGPVVKDQGSFMIAGRRSYGDLFLKLSPEYKDNQIYFYDLSSKVNYVIDEKNKVFLSGYMGSDVFSFKDQIKMDWGNTTGTFRWNHIFNPKLVSNFTLLYSDYNYAFGVPSGKDQFDWRSKIINQGAKVDFTWFLNPQSTVSFGGSSTQYKFIPGKITTGDGSNFNSIELDPQYGKEYAIYADHELKMSSNFRMLYGIRLSGFDYLGGRTIYDYKGEDGQRKLPVNERYYEKGESVKFYYNLEPRFSVNYNLDSNRSVKFSYNRMAQYLHLISNTTAATPFDVWSPSTNNIRPELADQIALGYFRNFRDNAVETSVEAYYKSMQNQIDYVNGADLLLNENLEADLLYGNGRSYGVEVFVRKNKGKFNGWLSYTLSRTERKIKGINNGEFYSAKYDKTHNVSAVGIYRLNNRWSFSGNFVYGTGVAITLPNGRFEQGGMVIPINTDNSRNNFRVPSYHRLDLSATWEGKKRPQRSYESSWVFSIYNAYSRRNPFSVYFRQNENDPKQTEAVRISVFGSIIPAVSYNFKF